MMKSSTLYMNAPTLALGALIALLPVLVQAEDRFSLQATFFNAALTSLSFDYRDGNRQALPGFTVNGTHMDGSACYAKIPGSDNLSGYLSSIKDKPAYREIGNTRKRMLDSLARNKLEIWQEVLCVANGAREIPYKETGIGNDGKWSSVPIVLNGQRQGAWNDVFTVARRRHLYSVTVHPGQQKQSGD